MNRFAFTYLSYIPDCTQMTKREIHCTKLTKIPKSNPVKPELESCKKKTKRKRKEKQRMKNTSTGSTLPHGSLGRTGNTQVTKALMSGGVSGRVLKRISLSTVYFHPPHPTFTLPYPSLPSLPALVCTVLAKKEFLFVFRRIRGLHFPIN